GFAEQTDLKESRVLVAQGCRFRQRHHLFSIEPHLNQTLRTIARPQDMNSEVVPPTGRELPLAGPVEGGRHPRAELEVLALSLERHQPTPAIASLEVSNRVVAVGEALGKVDAPAEVAFRTLGR